MKRTFTFLLTAAWMLCLFGTTVHAQSITVDHLTYTIAGGEATLTGYEATLPSGAVTVPDNVSGTPVTAIGAQAFLGCDALTAITLPASVTTVGDWAFMKCKNFTDINIPAGCTLGMGCFTACPALENITLDGGESNNYVIDNEGGKLTKGVLYTKDMKTLVFFIPTNIIDKAGQVVQNTGMPEQWKLPNTVETIAAGSLGENWLEHIILPSYLKTIEPYAFYRHKDYSLTTPDNWRMTELTIPAFVDNINMTAFLQETGETTVKTNFKNLFFMGTSDLLDKDNVANTLSKADPFTGTDIAYGSELNVYVKQSVYETFYTGYDPETWKSIYEIAPCFGVENADYRIPFDRLALNKPITMCRDFDIDFTKTKTATSYDSGYGYRPMAYIAMQFIEVDGFWEYDDWYLDYSLWNEESGDWGVWVQDSTWIDGRKYYEFTNTWYVPSRTGNNFDEYHGILVKIDTNYEIDQEYIDINERDGWNGPKLYYAIGERDYTVQDAIYSWDSRITDFDAEYWVYDAEDDYWEWKSINIPTSENRLVGLACNSHVPVTSDGVNHWGLASNGKWTKITTSKKMTFYNRAYLKPTAEENARMLAVIGSSSDGKIATFFIDEHSTTPTGIKTIENKRPKKHNNVWYTLDGQRLMQKPTTKGIYLYNGKKYIVK